MLHQKTEVRPFICFIGAPCSGKTTFASRLQWAFRYDVEMVSSGAVARKLAKQDLSVHRALEEGRLVDPRIFDPFFIRYIRTTHPFCLPDRYVIVDGYPRYFEQLLDLLAIPRPVFFVHIEVEREEAWTRMTHRERRGDSGLVFDRRWQTFEEKVQPMIDWLERSPYKLVTTTSDADPFPVMARITNTGVAGVA